MLDSKREDKLMQVHFVKGEQKGKVQRRGPKALSIIAEDLSSLKVG